MTVRQLVSRLRQKKQSAQVLVQWEGHRGRVVTVRDGELDFYNQAKVIVIVAEDDHPSQVA